MEVSFIISFKVCLLIKCCHLLHASVNALYYGLSESVSILFPSVAELYNSVLNLSLFFLHICFDDTETTREKALVKYFKVLSWHTSGVLR